MIICLDSLCLDLGSTLYGFRLWKWRFGYVYDDSWYDGKATRAIAFGPFIAIFGVKRR